MKLTINFGNLLTGLQCLAERDKLILVALINSHGAPQNGDKAEIERVIAQTIIAGAREKRTAAREIEPEMPHGRVYQRSADPLKPG